MTTGVLVPPALSMTLRGEFSNNTVNAVGINCTGYIAPNILFDLAPLPGIIFTIDSMTFVGFETSHWKPGGIVRVSGASSTGAIVVQNVTVDYITARMGAIVGVDGNAHDGEIHISNSDFSHISVSSQGGLVFIPESAFGWHVTMRNIRVSHAFAPAGAAVAFVRHSHLVVDGGSTFVDTHAESGFAGAVQVSNGSLVMAHVSFDDCSSTFTGCVGVTGADGVVTNVTVVRAHSTQGDGAAFSVVSDCPLNASLTLTDVSVTYSEARHGGAVRVYGMADCAPPRLIIARSTFAHNVGRLRAGAINVGNGMVVIDNSVIVNNTSPLGSAIYTNAMLAGSAVTNSLITDNLSTDNAATASAVFLGAGSLVDFADSAICSNRAPPCRNDISAGAPYVLNLSGGTTEAERPCLHGRVASCLPGPSLNLTCVACHKGWAGPRCSRRAHCVNPSGDVECASSDVQCFECEAGYGRTFFKSICEECVAAESKYFVSPTVPCGICDENCLDCTGSPSNCTACVSHLMLSAPGVNGIRVCHVANSDKDVCDVCFGGGSSIDACGVCFGSDACVDACSVAWGDNSTCAGCDGVPHSGRVRDVCGECGGDGSSCLGCDGVPVPLGGAHYDACGVCGGSASGVCVASCDNSTLTPVVFDCAGICNGSAFVDSCGVFADLCGVCGGDDSTCAGCDGLGGTIDVCGVCAGNGSTCALSCDPSLGHAVAYDCNGVCGGSALNSECGMCVGGTTGIPPAAFIDSCGKCFRGNADVDACGVCFGNNADRDACGVCHGANAALDSCGICFGGGRFEDVCGVCYGNSTLCAGCDAVVKSGLVYDDCGVCGGDGGSCTVASAAKAWSSQALVIATATVGSCIAGVVAAVIAALAAKRRRVQSAYVAAKMATEGETAPHGKVAVLITDVQSSTHLWEAHPSAMVAAIDAHNDAFRRLLARHGGYEVRTEGDSFVVVFADAAAAVAAAVDIQRELMELDWPEELLVDSLVPTVDHVWVGLRVRMGISLATVARTWVARTERFTYEGPGMVDAQMIGDCGCGGQVVVDADVATAATAAGFHLERLGNYSAPSSSKAYELWQVIIKDLTHLRGLDASSIRGLARLASASSSSSIADPPSLTSTPPQPPLSCPLPPVLGPQGLSISQPDSRALLSRIRNHRSASAVALTTAYASQDEDSSIKPGTHRSGTPTRSRRNLRRNSRNYSPGSSPTTDRITRVSSLRRFSSRRISPASTLTSKSNNSSQDGAGPAGDGSYRPLLKTSDDDVDDDVDDGDGDGVDDPSLLISLFVEDLSSDGNSLPAVLNSSGINAESLASFLNSVSMDHASSTLSTIGSTDNEGLSDDVKLVLQNIGEVTTESDTDDDDELRAARELEARQSGYVVDSPTSGNIWWPKLQSHKVSLSEEDLVLMADDPVEYLKRRSGRVTECIIHAQAQCLIDTPAAQVFGTLLEAILTLTDSEYGFIGEIVDVKGEPVLLTHAITNIAWNDQMREYYDNQIATKGGFVFDNLNTLFGRVMITGEPYIANSPDTDEFRSPAGRPEGHPPLNAFLGVPLKHGGELVGMVGVANRPVGYTSHVVEFLEPLLLTVGNIVTSFRNQRMRQFAESEVERMKNRLERTVRRRTRALRHKNTLLRAAVIKRMEMERIAITFAKTQSAFLAKMSHEIRTPLNGVIGMSELLELSPLNAQQRVYVSTIRSSANSLQAVISDVLDFSKIESDNLSLEAIAFSPVELIEQSAQIVGPKAESKGIGLVAHVSPATALTVVGDPSRLKQVILNLVNNAVKFTSVGRVVIHVVPTETSSTTQNLRITIEDTGIGISDEQLDRLFQPYRQAEASIARMYGGTGLGLVISKKIVELMGGSITVESTVDVGTSFIVDIPFALRADSLAPGPSALGGPNSTSVDNSISTDSAVSSLMSLLTIRDRIADLRFVGKRALLVEADPVASSAMELYCSTIGFEVETAESGMRAMLAVAKDTATAKAILDKRPYAYIFISTELGDVAADALAEQLQHMPEPPTAKIVVMSSYEKLNARWEVVFDATLVRPMLPHTVHDAITMTLTTGSAHGWLSVGSDSSFVTRLAPFDSSTTNVAAIIRLKMLLPDAFNVIIVDDNQTNLDVAQLMLSRLRLTAEAESDPEVALDKIVANSYDLVLLDCYMPSLSGYELTKRLREAEAELHPSRHTRVIAMSAAVMSQEVEKCMDAGMDGFIAKPLFLDALFSMLCKELEGYHAAIESALVNGDYAPEYSASISQSNSVSTAMTLLQKPSDKALREPAVASGSSSGSDSDSDSDSDMDSDSGRLARLSYDSKQNSMCSASVPSLCSASIEKVDVTLAAATVILAEAPKHIYDAPLSADSSTSSASLSSDDRDRKSKRKKKRKRKKSKRKLKSKIPSASSPVPGMDVVPPLVSPKTTTVDATSKSTLLLGSAKPASRNPSSSSETVTTSSEADLASIDSGSTVETMSLHMEQAPVRRRLPRKLPPVPESSMSRSAMSEPPVPQKKARPKARRNERDPTWIYVALILAVTVIVNKLIDRM
ncbi:uncharacterized protein AMSG_09879 [Thecamonas trahens ATCC 50062]|uniref:Uncharacterized protein n=1 Tax=Thecamonas trahens ATCC 50062 TaxID=461836 RepID=A0A0L0DPC4_THETB|nr:hypothetical protein AMSG_09879 [Thecamonas trahens ATCC 50062]KNC54105.1 hypothetical protein AMSG_09879 [Thecamonas trahens ATCC 50062]|eukprot:XP_013753928.1 hypothetical protein AMSG_09879 [Thecamonas trahens ATCC 50062]